MAACSSGTRDLREYPQEGSHRIRPVKARNRVLDLGKIATVIGSGIVSVYFV